MFGIMGDRKRRWRQAKRGGGKLLFWALAPRRGHVSNSGKLPSASGRDGLLADSTTCEHLKSPKANQESPRGTVFITDSGELRGEYSAIWTTGGTSSRVGG